MSTQKKKTSNKKSKVESVKITKPDAIYNVYNVTLEEQNGNLRIRSIFGAESLEVLPEQWTRISARKYAKNFKNKSLVAA